MRIDPDQPWYREPWPWILMAFPAASILMGIAMVVLALRTNDGLVAGDYYKQGLAINQVLDREERARVLGISARLTFDADRIVVRVVLAGLPSAQTAAVRLAIAHPTRAGEDQELALAPGPVGELHGRLLRRPAAGRWNVVLEDTRARWRLIGVWRTGENEVVLEAGRK